MSADSATGSSSRPKNRQRYGAPASASSSITAQRALHVARAEAVDAPAVDPARAGCPVRGRCRGGRRAATGASAGPASTQVSPRSRTATPPARSTPATWAASARLVARLRGDVDSSSVRAASRSPRSATRPHNSLTRRMRYCGVDVSAKPANQQLVTLHERRDAEGGMELVATFYAPGTVEQVARTVEGFGRGERGRRGRRAVRAAARPARAPARRCARELGLPDGRYERMRVCDALLFRRGLPLYPVPAAARRRSGVGGVDRRRLRAVRRARRLGLYRPERARRLRSAPVGAAALRFGRAVRDLPGRDLLRAARPPAVAQAHAVGPAAADRRAAAEGRRATPTAGSGTARSTSSTRARRPTPRTRSPPGSGSWVGDPREGVIVLPVAELRARYEKLPPPARAALA